MSLIDIVEKEIALDLPLDERRVHAKFGCTGSYRVQMHKEQTDKLSSLYIRFIMPKNEQYNIRKKMSSTV